MSDKQSMTKAPHWYRSVDDQYAVAMRFLEAYGDDKAGFRPSDIPAAPSFTPRTKTEVLLLAVYLPAGYGVSGFERTFEAWWNFMAPPAGLTKRRGDGLKSDSQHLHLRVAPGIEYAPGIRWVAFDPNVYQGKSSKDALAQSVVDGTTLAHAEVLMAAAMFPEWVSRWNGGRSPIPNLSGCQLYWLAGWSDVPFLNRWDESNRLVLDVHWAGFTSSLWSSPTVREL